jgi:hypothetical protein
MAQAAFKEWERDIDLESRTLGKKRIQARLERGLELEPHTLGKGIQARKGHGCDIEPRTVERIQER